MYKTKLKHSRYILYINIENNSNSQKTPLNTIYTVSTSTTSTNSPERTGGIWPKHRSTPTASGSSQPLAQSHGVHPHFPGRSLVGESGRESI